MNTRIALFIACLLSLVIFTSAMLNKQHDTRTTMPATHITETTTDTKKQERDATVPPSAEWPEGAPKVHAHTHCDDDGQKQHFHFNRINQLKRGRRFLLFVAKLLLLIVHLCSLLSGFSQLAH